MLNRIAPTAVAAIIFAASTLAAAADGPLSVNGSGIDTTRAPATTSGPTRRPGGDGYLIITMEN